MSSAWTPAATRSAQVKLISLEFMPSKIRIKAGTRVAWRNDEPITNVPAVVPRLDEARYMGVLFVVLTIACLALGITTLVWDTPVVYVASRFTCGLAVLGYVATRLVAFPMLADDVGNWLQPSASYRS